MKIGLVLDDSLDKTDGVQQYVITLGHWLQREGHEVHYLVGETKRRDLAHIHSLSRNIQVHFNQNRMSMPLHANSRNIKELLEREDFDVLHVQMPFSPFMAGKVVKHVPARTAVVGTFHILPYSRLESFATRLLGLWLRRRLKRFDHVWSVSQPAAKFVKKTFRLKSEVLPNAVNVSRFHTGKKLRKFRGGKLTMLYLGRLVERKGCMYFLQALELLHRENLLYNARVVIAGKGPQEDELKEYVQKHHLGKVVQFAGFISEEEKPDYLASADVAVMPSTGGESFGIVLVEAMAAGSGVVIGGNNKGYRSVLGERPDQLVKPRDSKAFAKTIKHFMFNEQARTRAHNWQTKKAAEYDVRTIGTRLVEVYLDALRQR